MKQSYKILIVAVLLTVLTACKTEKKLIPTMTVELSKENRFSLLLSPGKSFNHPSFVIWVEDMNQNYIKTIYITKSYASGIFERKMIGDSSWQNTSGESIQPAALPYWTHKKSLINNKSLVPTADNPFVDAYTGATPKGEFVLKDKSIDLSQYRILIEVNQPWDWNEFWTNNKYPESKAYKNSAQPSVIYSASINPVDEVFYLNPIGHGSPTGKDAKLYTDLSNLTTALEIFSLLKLRIKR